MTDEQNGIYFTDIFGVDPDVLAEYGAFNVSLLTDLPLFVDPFLLFNSQKPEYQALHEQIILYLRYLRDKSAVGLSERACSKRGSRFTRSRRTGSDSAVWAIEAAVSGASSPKRSTRT